MSETGSQSVMVGEAPAHLALEAVRLWGGDDNTLALIGHSGNSVYRFRRDDEPLILRLTDTRYRSLEANEAELELLRHLAREGVQVSAPVSSSSGQWVAALGHSGQPWLASAFHWAPGETVEPGHAAWGPEYWHAWGYALGALHRGARRYRPSLPARRWEWREEPLLAAAPELLADDVEVREALEAVMATISALPKDAVSFGLIHADHGPQNFFYVPGRGVTTFDFGNCCYHWYLQDLAIALGILHRLAEKDYPEAYRQFVTGYRTVAPLPDESLDPMGLFVTLRRHYVYLSRLMKFGAQPTEAQQEILVRLRAKVFEPSPQLCIPGV